MLPELHIPGQVVGLVLILAGLAWFFGWRRSADEKERQMAPFGGVFGLVGLVLLSGVAGTITWPTYGFCMASGCLALSAFTVYWARKTKLLSVEHTFEALLITGVCGLIGARAVFLVETWDLHFADQPARVVLAHRSGAELAKGDTLILSTGGAPFTITFTGEERSFSQLKAAIDAAGANQGISARLVVHQHRGDEGISLTERGLILETSERGPNAQIRLHGGSAAPKLSLAYQAGRAVPLTKIFDLRGGGLTYFGSVIGVLLAAAIYLRFRKVGLIPMLDLVAPALPLGLFFGRLGCLSYGCCWGREAGANALLSVEFGRWSPAWHQFAREKLSVSADPALKLGKDLPPELVDSLGELAHHTPPLHATQLYEGLTVLLVFLLVLAYRVWGQKRVGQAFALVVLLQAPVRFVVEHFRRDHEVFFELAGYAFTESQLVALLMFTLAVPAMVYASRRGTLLSELAPSDAPGDAPGDAPSEASPEDTSAAPAAAVPAADAPSPNDALTADEVTADEAPVPAGGEAPAEAP